MSRFILFLLCFVSISLGNAQDLVTSPNDQSAALSIFDEEKSVEPLQVKLDLGVDQAVQGKAFWLGIELSHGETWHSYWKNSGGVSLPVRFDVEVEGGTAGDIHWPTPKRIDGPNGMTFSYEGKVVFPVLITPDQNANEIKVKTRVRAQLCDDKVCLPPKQYEAHLTVPVQPSGDGGEPTKIMAEHLEKLPQKGSNWALSAALEGKTLVMQLKPTSAEKVISGAKPQEIYSAIPGVLAEWEPTITAIPPDVGGGWEIRFPEFEQDPPDQEELSKSEVVVLFDQIPVQDGNSTSLLFVPGESNAAGDRAVTENTAEKAAFVPVTMPSSQLAWLFGIAFLGGLILNVMPCVFPVLGLKVVSFVKQSGEEKHKIVMHGLAFTAGVLLCFLALGLLVLSVRASGNLPTWGTMFNNPQVVWIVLILIFLLGLNMAGVFEFGDSLTSTGGNLAQKSGYVGSFFSGLFATIVGTPCAAPFLGTALGAAFTLPGFWSLSLLLTMGLGLSAPYLLFSIFPQMVKLLPKPGEWMVTFKQIMAFSMFAAAAYFIYILSMQTREAFLSSMVSLVLIAMAAWVMGRWNTWEKTTRTRVIASVSSLAILLSGTFLGWPATARTSGSSQAESGGDAFRWEEWTPEREKEILASGGTVIVDYTAAWCPTCLVNKSVWKKPEVEQLIKDKKITMLKADWTSPNPEIDKALAKLGKVAIPVNTLQGAGMDKPFIFKELLMTSDVVDALKKHPVSESASE